MTIWQGDVPCSQGVTLQKDSSQSSSTFFILFSWNCLSWRAFLVEKLWRGGILSPSGACHRHRQQSCGAAAHGMFQLASWALLGVVRAISDSSSEKIQNIESDSWSSFESCSSFWLWRSKSSYSDICINQGLSSLYGFLLLSHFLARAIKTHLFTVHLPCLHSVLDLTACMLGGAWQKLLKHLSWETECLDQEVRDREWCWTWLSQILTPQPPSFLLPVRELEE